ncbi:MAG: hypothetical protein CMN30_20475 [Sandaracinus sp.]|nr:hypothetical protein [Sandaracinus sp.]
MPFRAVTIAFLAGLLGAAPVAAQESWVARWDAPAGCPDGAAVSAAVERLLGPSAEAHRSTLALDGRITRDGERFHLALILRDATGAAVGTRELGGATCPPLAEAAALLAALAVDPGALSTGEPEPEVPPGPTGELQEILPAGVTVERGANLDAPTGTPQRDAAPLAEEPSPAPGAPEPEYGEPGAILSQRMVDPDAGPASTRPGAPDEPTTGDAVPFAFGFDARLALELGTLPEPAAALRLGATFARRWLRIAALAEALFPRTTTVPRDPVDAEARFYALGARLELGTAWSRGAFALGGGLVGALHSIRGASAGVSLPAAGAAPLLTLGGVLRVLLRRGRFAVGIEGDVRASVAPATYGIDGLDWSHRPAAWVGQVGVVVRVGEPPG